MRGRSDHDRPPRLSRERFAELQARLAVPTARADLGGGWELGVPTEWLQELLVAWRAFDLAGFQRELDGQTHRLVDVDGLVVHVREAGGRGPDPLVLLLTHGWPGSFLEYAELIPRLVDPAAHGADPRDAFTVVAPSLPGFGFSAAPPPPGYTTRRIAGVWNGLMRTLGHARYVAHGSDLGAGVTAWLARDHPDGVDAIHLATPGLAVSDPRDAAQARFAEEVGRWTAEEGGYMHEQATKPATLSIGLADSPAGLAAWIGEKVVSWSGTRGDGSPAFSERRLLETLTLYWCTNTVATSLLPYWTHGHLPGAQPPIDDPGPTPAAVTIFGGERVPFPKPPRSLAERFLAVTRWTEHDRGGHFPAVAEPDLLAEEIRAAFRPLRGGELRA